MTFVKGVGGGKDYRWKKGQSGNPRGRPPTGLAMAEYIRAKVRPRELVDKLLDIIRNSKDEGNRIKAANTLMERGWVKPPQQYELEMLLRQPPPPMPFDFNLLTREQRRALRDLLKIAKGETPMMISGCPGLRADPEVSVSLMPPRQLPPPIEYMPPDELPPQRLAHDEDENEEDS